MASWASSMQGSCPWGGTLGQRNLEPDDLAVVAGFGASPGAGEGLDDVHLLLPTRLGSGWRGFGGSELWSWTSDQGSWAVAAEPQRDLASAMDHGVAHDLTRHQRRFRRWRCSPGCDGVTHELSGLVEAVKVRWKLQYQLGPSHPASDGGRSRHL